MARKELLGDLGADALGDDDGPVQIGIGKEHDELLAAVASRDIRLAGDAAERRADDGQRSVAPQVPVGVVVKLVVVDVGHQQAHLMVLPDGAIHLQHEALAKMIVIEEARFAVADRLQG
jgi:hypothetical protein